ncbi:hypothetical protein D3C85_971040 [compost metagenome]
MLALANRHEHLLQQEPDAQHDQRGASQRDQQVGLPFGVVVVVQAARHALEAQDVQGHEGHEETDEPAVERVAAQALIQREAECLREPVRHARDTTEHHATDDGVVEVGDQEQAVVQHEGHAGDGQHHAGHAADDEDDHEAQRPQHRRRDAQAAAVDGEQPVEDLGPGRDRDDHCRDAEEGIDVGPRSHGEEVVQPDQERQHADGGRGVNHGLVAEQRLAGKGGNHFRIHAKRRQHQDVDLGVAPDPDQVHVHHDVAAHVVREEVRAQVAVHRQQRQGRGQHGEGGDDQDVGDQRGPREDRHLHQAHARRAHAQDGHDEVDAAKRCAQPGYLERPDVVVDPDAWAVVQPRQRRIGEPAGRGEFAHEQRDHHQRDAGAEQPEAQRVQERVGHVAGADLQRHHDVHQPGNEGHRHEENHDDAVGGEDLVVVVRWQESRRVGGGDRQLGAHHDGVGKAAQQHDQRDDDVHHADALVVDGREPFRPEVLPLAEVGDGAEDR